MNKKRIKEVNKAILAGSKASVIVATVVGSLYGIIFLTQIHWTFYGLIPIWMWIILYIFISVIDNNDVKEVDDE